MAVKKKPLKPISAAFLVQPKSHFVRKLHSSSVQLNNLELKTNQNYYLYLLHQFLKLIQEISLECFLHVLLHTGLYHKEAFRTIKPIFTA